MLNWLNYSRTLTGLCSECLNVTATAGSQQGLAEYLLLVMLYLLFKHHLIRWGLRGYLTSLLVSVVV